MLCVGAACGQAGEWGKNVCVNVSCFASDVYQFVSIIWQVKLYNQNLPIFRCERAEQTKCPPEYQEFFAAMACTYPVSAMISSGILPVLTSISDDRRLSHRRRELAAGSWLCSSQHARPAVWGLERPSSPSVCALAEGSHREGDSPNDQPEGTRMIITYSTHIHAPLLLGSRASILCEHFIPH